MIWRNLWRNTRRSLITIASVTFAVLLAILMRSLQEGVFDNLIRNVVSFYSGYIQIHKKGYWDERTLDNLFEAGPELSADIQQQDFVSVLVPRIESFALTSTGELTYGCFVTGTDLEKESRLSGLQNRIRKGRYLSDSQENAALIGEGLAEKLGVDVNDTIVLLGQGYQGNIAAGKYYVKGILYFGSPQMNQSSVYLSLKTARQWLSAENMLSAFVIGLDDPDGLEEKAARLRAALSRDYEVMTWKEMMPDIENHIRMDTVNFYFFIGILYLIIAFGIFSTILMMTNERRYELGLLAAIGMTKARLMLMLLGETVLLGLLGALTGILLSLPIVILLERRPIRIGGKLAEAYERFGFEPIFPAVLKTEILLIQGAIVLLITLLAGLYPLNFIRRLNILNALRK